MDKFLWFKNLIEENNLSGSYLFFGCREKSLEFALKLLNFLENKESEQTNNLVDGKVVKNGESSIGVGEIRDIKTFLFRRPFLSSYRTALIASAENLTKEANNALLKIAEELPDKGVIIFIASSPYALFPTLVSRLTKVYFSHINEDKTNKTLGGENKLLYSKIKRYQRNILTNRQKLKWLLRREFYLRKFNLNRKLQERAIEKI